jgi:O-acetyl-ADP-ribose deacetylase (regulator of RNase III)
VRDDVDRQKVFRQGLDKIDESDRDTPLSDLVADDDPDAIPGILEVLGGFPYPSGDFRWLMVEHGWQAIERLWEDAHADALYEELGGASRHFRRRSVEQTIFELLAEVDRSWAAELLTFFEAAVDGERRETVAALEPVADPAPDPDFGAFGQDQGSEWWAGNAEIPVRVDTARLLFRLSESEPNDFLGVSIDDRTVQFTWEWHPEEPETITIADLPVLEGGRFAGSYHGPVDDEEAERAIEEFAETGEYPGWLQEKLAYGKSDPPADSWSTADGQAPTPEPAADNGPDESWIRIEPGDIAEARTEAIVNAWNRNFIPHWLLIPQGVAGALKRAAGPEPFREVTAEGMLDPGEAAATSAGDLPADYIIHAAALHWYWKSSEEAVGTAARNVFARAEELGVDSLAIPLLGAGTGGLAPADSLELILDAWRASDRRLPTEVWVYSTDLAIELDGKFDLPD